MANRYWVGGAGNWNSTTKWSTTSGGANGASVPGTGDAVIFNASSGVGIATLNINANVQSLTMTGYTGTLAFGTNTISLNSTGAVYTGDSTYSVTGTPVINVTSTGSTAITVACGSPTEANSISFNFTGGTYTLDFLGPLTNARSANFTGFSGTWATVSNGTLYGNLTLSSTMTFNSTGAGIYFSSSSATQTVTSNGKSFGSSVVSFNGTGGTRVLADPLICGQFSFGAGTSNLNDNTITCSSFLEFGTGVARVLAFGAGSITCNGTGTVFSLTATNLTVTGTPIVNISNNSATAATVTVTGLSEAQSISFNFTIGTYTLTSTAANVYRNLSFAGFSGSVSNSTMTVYGDLTLSSAAGFALNGTANITMASTSAATRVITTNAKTVDRPIIFNGVGGSWQLADALTVGATRTTTLTNGTLDLSGKTLTTGLFASNNSNTRTIAFGAGNITCNNSAAGGTLWNTGTVTGLTVTGTPVVNISNSGALATTVAAGTLNEANAISFNFTTGTYSLSFLNTASYTAKNVNFTGFAGTWAATSTGIVYGNFTLSTGMTLTASASTLRFGATSGTQIITTNAKTIDFTLAVNGVGGTVKLADALTMGATRTFNITNGTFDGDNKTISGAASINPSLSTTGTYTIKNVSTALTFYTGQSSVVTLGSDCTFGAFNQINNSTSLDLASFQLTCASFISPAGTSRTLAFGTGNITITGSGTVFQNAATITGTPVVNVTYAGATAVTVQPGALAEATAISFNFSAGTYPLTLFANLGESVKNLNFTGYAGAWNRSSTCIIYGNLTLSAGMTTPASSGLVNFRATSGVQIITSNAVTYDGAFGIDGVGGTVRLADALLMGTTRTLTHTNGTLDLNGKTLTVGTSYTTATGTKDLTFNGGTLVCPTAATTAFNNAVPTGFTTTAGTGTGKISMTAATAKTFVGGGSTYNCTLSNDGAGALTISGSNTFTTIANGVQPTAFTFTAATTQTVTNWTVSGISGSLVTIISSTVGTAATLSKSSGTVSSNYLSLKDSTATGGATWYAGANSTNVSGNSGWIFTAPPATSAGSFFFMF